MDTNGVRDVTRGLKSLQHAGPRSEVDENCDLCANSDRIDPSPIPPWVKARPPALLARELPPAPPPTGEPCSQHGTVGSTRTHPHGHTSHSRSIMEAGQIRHLAIDLAKQGLLDEKIPSRPTAPSSPWRLGAWAAPSPRTWRAAPPGRRVGRRAPWAASRGSKGNWPLLQWDRQGLATRRHGF